MVQGTFSEPIWVVGFINGGTLDLTTTVTLNQYLSLWGGAPFAGKIGGVQANARATGTGAGNTVIDVLINGSTIWPIHPTNRPTLASASTGAFTSQPPELTTFQKGDKIDIQVVTIPATSGHRGVSCVVTLERPHGGAINQ